MASDAEGANKVDGGGRNVLSPASIGTLEKQNGEDDGASEDEEEEEEPRLKYASLTKHLKAVYRNGDATSAFLVAGDKMVNLSRAP